MCNSVVDTDVFFLLNPAITMAWNLIDLQSHICFNTVSLENHSVLIFSAFFKSGSVKHTVWGPKLAHQRLWKMWKGAYILDF